VRTAWTIVALVLLACTTTRADERILSYDSTITVQKNGTLNVHETIRVRSEGNQIRRGIYRDFPTTYNGRNGERYVVGFDFQSAQRDGSTEDWHSERLSNGVRIYLGRKNVLLPAGEHVYDIYYRADHELGYFADHDELYWNVTGVGWIFPIDSASARVVLPTDIPQNEIQLEGYTGPQGAKGTAYTAQLEDDGTPSFATTRGLNDHEGLTIVVMWPKGFVMPPVETISNVFLRGNAYVGDKLPAIIGIGGVALLLVYYLLIWHVVGRDPAGRIPIPEYTPPPNISPGAMRYLTSMKYDDRCFAADVLNLAVKGHLVIKEDKRGLFGTKKEFTLIKETSPNPKPLTPEETTLLTKLFSLGTELELTQDNHEWVSSVKSFHRRLLKGRFIPNFFRINGGWHALGIVWSILVIVVMVKQYALPEWYFTTRLGWITIAALVGGLFANGLFGYLLKAPTVAGQALLDKVRGFKLYLEVAEGEDLKRVTTPPPPLTPELYHLYLPAALGLGVEQRWSERFAQVFAEQPGAAQPGWYSGNSWDHNNLSSFSSGLGSSFDNAISSASTAPGSSSGGDGGGSSGGGGGGGGGGGW
jgi:hypothetical protein